MAIPSPGGGARQQGGAQRPAERVIPFGKYLLLERISVGGMAEVFKAKSFGIEGFEKILAVKRILPTMAEDRDFIEMFIDEAKIAGHLNHANIAPIYELGKVGDSHYIAMEYVWGKDLLQIMNRFRKMRKHMPPAMVAFIASKICEGLDYAHRKRDRNGNPMNIIHRDMSPQNVLCSYEGQVKIIDFGIAKAASRTTKTQAGVLKGKFGYMSPEQVRGLPVDARSDLFAVGTVMHELATSERLFLGESDFTTLEKVRNADVLPVTRSIPDFPPELEAIIMKALTLDVADRWQSASEMQEALVRFLASQKPPYGTSKLAAWMKTAFAAELAQEKERMAAYATVGRAASPPASAPAPAPAAPRPASAPSAGPAPAAGRPPPPGARKPTMMGLGAPAPDPSAAASRPPPPRPSPAARPGTEQLDIGDLQADEFDDDEIQGEKTVVGTSLMDEDPAPATDLAEQPTQIFFSADELKDDGPAAPVVRPQAGPSASVQVAPQVAVGAAHPAPPGMAPPGMPPPGMAPPGMPPTGMAPPGLAPPPGMAHAGAHATAPSGPAHAPGGPQGPGPGAPPAPVGFALPPVAAGPETVAAGPGASVATVRPGAVATASFPAQPAPKKSGGVGKIVGIALAAIVLLAVGAGGAVLAFGPQKGGTIDLQTVPTVAGDVYVDGVLRGRTPVRLENLAPGEHLLEVRADGYQTAQRRVAVASGAVAMMEVALIPGATPLSPPVAGAPQGLAAPGGGVGAPAVAPAVAGVVPGLPAAGASADRSAAQAAAQAAAAQQAAAQAAAAQQAAAQAAAAQQAAAQAAAAQAAAQRAAAHATAAQQTQAGTPPAGGRSGGVGGAPRTSGTSGPERAGSERGATASVAAGGGGVRSTEPSGGGAGSGGSSGGGRGGAAGQGTLAISTQPWARVFIDGRDTRRDTPVRDLRVRAGTHTIGLRKPDGTMVEIEVDVVADQTTTIIRRL
jgi:hypothetical protein